MTNTGAAAAELSKWEKEQEKPEIDDRVDYLYISVDIECTGRYLLNGIDIVNAVGFCAWTPKKGFIKRLVCLDLYGDLTFATSVVLKEGIKVNDPEWQSKVTKLIDTRTAPLTLEEWREVWMFCKWELSCFEEFWTKNIPMLNFLCYKNPTAPNPDMVDSRGALVHRVNDILKEYESMAKKTFIVTDTGFKDAAALSYLLQDYKYEPLEHTRAGEYRRAIHASMYRHGILGWTIEERDANPKEYKKDTKMVDSLLPELGEMEHNHNPACDAHNLLLSFMRSMEMAKQLRLKRKHWEDHDCKRFTGPGYDMPGYGTPDGF